MVSNPILVTMSVLTMGGSMECVTETESFAENRLDRSNLDGPGE